MIYLTSFRKSAEMTTEVEKWSAAVYQPKGFSYPKVDCFDIRNARGQWIRPREFISENEPLVIYRKALLNLYLGRSKRILKWVNSTSGDIALCCWCPYERAAQRQIKEWGSFVCHLSVVGEYLTNYTEEVVWYDSDRLKMAVLTQKFYASKKKI